jgi:hypothetical protein
MRSTSNYPTPSEYWMKRSEQGTEAEPLISRILDKIAQTKEGHELSLDFHGFQQEVYIFILMRLKELGWHAQAIFRTDRSGFAVTLKIDLSMNAYIIRSQTSPSINV